MKTPNLETLIREDKNALSNREGLKPLFSFAVKIQQGSSEFSKEEIEKEIFKLNILSFNAEEVQTFLSFIYYSQLNSERLLKYLYTFIENKKEKNTDSIFIYALLLRFIIERDSRFLTLRQLISEFEIKEHFPWIWIDCISYLNWEYCVDEIGKLFQSQETGFKNLIIRIPGFQKRFGKEKIIAAFKRWHPNLNVNDRVKLEKWATEFNIKFGLSISAERLIENAAFLQNQIM